MHGNSKTELRLTGVLIFLKVKWIQYGKTSISHKTPKEKLIESYETKERTLSHLYTSIACGCIFMLMHAVGARNYAP